MTNTIAEIFGIHAQPWISQALCPQHEPDIFYAPPTAVHTQRTAKSICADCPVRAECLTHAIEHDETHGVWGGLTARERRDLTRADRPATITAQCGTTTGASQHYRRGEPCCAACRTAASEARKNQRASNTPRNTLPPTPTGKCGTEAGAKRHAARGERPCTPCSEASTTARRRRLGRSA